MLYVAFCNVTGASYDRPHRFTFLVEAENRDVVIEKLRDEIIRARATTDLFPAPCEVELEDLVAVFTETCLTTNGAITRLESRWLSATLNWAVDGSGLLAVDREGLSFVPSADYRGSFELSAEVGVMIVPDSWPPP